MNVFIIGASGLVGSHCQSLFIESGNDVVGTHYNYKTDKTVYLNPFSVNLEEYFESQSFIPEVIIHCAALTNVDYCEEHSHESYNLTVLLTKKLVEYCSQTNVKLVYISTDYIFDGIEGPYSENSKVNPINIYGQHKLICEDLVKSLNKHIIARITNVYGEEARSKNFVARLVENLMKNEIKTMILPYDQYATPIYAGDIAKMLHLLISDEKEGIYNLASTDYYSRFHLAKKIISYYPNNNSVLILPTATSDLKQSAQRPLNGGLLNNKFVNEYPEFLFTNVDSFIIKSIKNGL